MSINQLIESMAKLLKLHKSLLELALRKTGILEAEDVAALSELLKEEQAHILAIEKIEAERSRNAGKRMLNELLEKMPDPERATLAEISQELKEVITRIQVQNELNQGLITQSLKFISFSMSLITPSQEEFNYGKNELAPTGKSLFNSKA
ncbi:flagellar protein FlgN [Bacillus sp. JJ1609]|uniref:flagellar protein FlgN n=1 Tax=Bacillus sp. JJ1609 TaxID=3122977 RepID=UPI002FFE8A9D